MAFQVLYLMLAAILLVMLLAMLDPANSLAVTLAFFAPVLLVWGGIWAILRAGHVVVAGWLLSGLYFLAITNGVLVQGSIQNNAPMGYVVAVMMPAAMLGRRAAMVFAGLSALVITAIAGAQAYDLLPDPVSPADSLINAWIAATVPLGLAAYLLHLSLGQMQVALAAAGARQRERDRAQADLIQAQKMDVVGRLAASIAHDFNNLLTVVLASTSLMRGAERVDEEALDDIDNASKRAALLTARLLAFGRPRDLEPRPVDLAAALRDFAPLLQRLAGDEVRVVVGVGAGRVTVAIDPVAVEQIVLNLVMNAREALQGSGQVDICLEIQLDQAVLTVTDTGPGIPEAIRERIFEPFFTTKASGTGLGLATVKRLMDMAGGSLSVGPGPTGGARFELRFPLLSGYTSPRGAPARVYGAEFPLRVLLVEDNDLVRAASASSLRALGWTVREAVDGLSALSVFETETFDVVVTDQAMHGLSGVELMGRMRQARPNLPVVIVSGHPLVAELPVGVIFLQKPFARTDLVGAISEVMGPVNR